MKHTIFFLLLCAFSQNVFSANYFIATNGNDSNKGNIESPFATLKQAQSVIESGDTVFFRGGTYHITTDMIMNIRDTYACVFDMAKSGKSANERICYWGYANERPVFDLSAVKPEGLRVSVFYVTGSYLHFKNSEIVGTQVTITGHTQSECISARGGSYNIYELLSMHDGMAIGFYLTKGVDNLLLNCDAYNNYDNYSEGSKGGNVDGFGAHPNNISYTGNIFRGCCAWYNSDDGFDLINAWAPVTIEHCWAFRNGYQPESTASAGDGTGIKAGGYGMSSSATVPSAIPEHVVKNCISYYNRNMGIYANHHLGGIYWENNSAYKNRSNYNMINCKSLAEAVDVDGYEHTLKNNLSYQPRVSGEDLINCNTTLSVLVNNTFYPTVWNVAESDFISLDEAELIWPRQADGSLPEIGFLKPHQESLIHIAGIGYSIEAEGENKEEESSEEDEEFSWMIVPGWHVEGVKARIVGAGAKKFTRFFINNVEIIRTGECLDLSSFTGTLHLKALSINGEVTRVCIER